ncbi:hypothetical protein [Lacticaseibacillus saniviri]
MKYNQQEVRFIAVIETYWPNFQATSFVAESYTLGASEIDSRLRPSWLDPIGNVPLGIDLVEAVSNRAESLQFVDFYDTGREKYYGSEVLKDGIVRLELDAKVGVWHAKAENKED